VRLMIALAVVLLLVGCGQAASPVEKLEKRQGPERIENGVLPKEGSPYIPDYDITMEKDCADTGVVGKCYTVATDATSKEDLEVVTADLWLENPEYLVVLVTFYPDKPTADVSGAGFAFKNEQAARVVLKQLTAEGATVEDEVREAMANGGIYVISADDEMRELSEVTTG
jgi:hypothetical protein